MDAARQKQLLIVGATGGGLALVYLLSRSRGNIPAGAPATDASVYNTLIRNIEQMLTGTTETLRAETAEAITTSENKQAGLLDTLKNTLNEGIAALTGRVSTLETAQTALATEVSTLKKQAGELGAGYVSQQQALVMEQDARLQAAYGAVFANLSRWGTSQVKSEALQYARATAKEFGLNPHNTAMLISMAGNVSDRFARGQVGGREDEMGWRAPLIPGPQGAGSRALDGYHEPKRVAQPGMVWGVFGRMAD